MNKTLQEFKQFISKGNVFDLAVALIIGGAFGKIVTSFVKDLFMPIIVWMMGNSHISEMKIVLVDASGETIPELSITYGMFLQTTIDFLLISVVVFIMIKMLNKLKKKEVIKPVAQIVPTNEEVLLTEIRDLLKK